MECEKTLYAQNLGRPSTEYDCLNSPTLYSSVNRCPTDWDPIAGICWPSAPPGSKPSLPCPDLPDINKSNFACRFCLENGTWYVNREEDNPYTNFHDCFAYPEREERLRLVKTLGEDKLLIFETLTRPMSFQYYMHGVCMLLLAISLVVWFVHWIYYRKQSRGVRKYVYMTSSCVALICIQISIVLYYSLHYYNNLISCYLFRMIYTLFECVFYTIILNHTLNLTITICEVSFCRPLRIAWPCVCTIAIITALVLEAWIENVRAPHSFCLFGLYLNPFHWLILAFKLSLNGGTFILAFVSLFGLLFMTIPLTLTEKRKKIIRHNFLLLLIFSLYSFGCLMSPVFIDHMYNMGYASDSIVYATRVYANMTASHGILFVLLTCAFDLEVVALVVPCVKRWVDVGEDIPFLRVRVIKADKLKWGFIWS